MTGFLTSLGVHAVFIGIAAFVHFAGGPWWLTALAPLWVWTGIIMLFRKSEEGLP